MTTNQQSNNSLSTLMKVLHTQVDSEGTPLRWTGMEVAVLDV